MLKFFGITHKFITFMQSGMYLDYIVKKFSEIFVKNFLIYGATFFGEKFLVEFISRKSFDKLTSSLSSWIVNRSFETSSIFHLTVCFIIGVVLLLEFTFLFILA